jgi:hypothetical protein
VQERNVAKQQSGVLCDISNQTSTVKYAGEHHMVVNITQRKFKRKQPEQPAGPRTSQFMLAWFCILRIIIKSVAPCRETPLRFHVGPA